MENASKALLIAGAILICILLIAVGMYIYQSAQGTIESAAAKMNNQDKEIYNSTVKKYIGENKKGSEVKQMIEAIISQNDTYVGESGKFVSIKVEGEIPNLRKSDGTTIDKSGSELATRCDAANVYATGTPGENTQNNIDAAKKEMRQLYKAISSGKNYTVSDVGGTKDGIIHTVTVKEN